MGQPEGVQAHPSPKRDSEHPGYETQDVSVGGIITFLAGLSGFVIIFFFFCFAMGKAINYALVKHDGEPDKWHSQTCNTRRDTAWREARRPDIECGDGAAPTVADDAGISDAAAGDRRRQPGYCRSACARRSAAELLQHSQDLPAGTIRIPIDRAMQLIVQRGLPAGADAAAGRRR